MVAIEGDSAWGEQQSDVSVVHIIPVIEVIDTTGAFRARFTGARTPRWSPDGTLLAVRKVRRPYGPRIGGFTPEYPETPDSVLVWNADRDTLLAFPLAADAISWERSEVRTHVGSSTCMLNLQRGPGNYTWQFGIEVSPDGKYSMDPGRLERFKVWDHYSRTPITKEVLRKIGGVAVQERPLPFWVTPAGHILCVGVLDEKDGKKRFPSKRVIWRTIFLDMQKMRVVRSIQARLLAPTADHSKAVVRIGDRFGFVGLNDGG